MQSHYKNAYMVIVAQLVRASVCGTEGRGFESRLSPKKQKSLRNEGLFLYNLFELSIIVEKPDS